jgi:hypothetical protein
MLRSGGMRRNDMLTDFRGIEQGSVVYIWVLGAHDGDSDGEVLGYSLCFWLAVIVYCICI